MGFGCAGLSGIWNAPLPEEEGIRVIKHAFSKGVTFFDTSDMYGPYTNEILIGKVSFCYLQSLSVVFHLQSKR